MSNRFIDQVELAEVLRRVAGTVDQGPTSLRLRAEADRLAPPKAEWPKRETWSNRAPALDVECYPIGVVGPVVEAFKKECRAHGLACSCFSCNTLIDFNRACKGE